MNRYIYAPLTMNPFQHRHHHETLLGTYQRSAPHQRSARIGLLDDSACSWRIDCDFFIMDLA